MKVSEKEIAQRKYFPLTFRCWSWGERPPDAHMLLRANEPKGGRVTTCFSLCLAQTRHRREDSNKRRLKHFHSEKSSLLNYMRNNKEFIFFFYARALYCIGIFREVQTEETIPIWDAVSQPTAHPQRSPIITASTTAPQVRGRHTHIFSTDSFFCESTAENRKQMQLNMCLMINYLINNR